MQHHSQVYSSLLLLGWFLCMNFEQKMSLLKQITKTSLLIPYVQFYIQSQYCHKELIPEQNTGENNPMYQLIFDPCIYVTARNIHSSVLWRSANFLDLSTTTLFHLQDCLYWWHIQYSNLTLSHSETLYCIFWKTFNVTSYNLIFSCFLSFLYHKI